MGDGLTAKQKLFVLEYLKDLNATQAAVRAGYNRKTARSIGAENLTKPDITRAIEAALTERLEISKTDSAAVLQRLVDIDQLDILDILNDDGTVKPLSDWPKVWLRSLCTLEIHEKYQSVNGERVCVGVINKIRLPDKLKNLELIGKHVDVQAFSYKHKVNSAIFIDELMRNIDCQEGHVLPSEPTSNDVGV
ncbi:terminase small subunit [Methylophaga thiooxydans]|nr:terminase small subunit [Methylophaga thiooxydans]